MDIDFPLLLVSLTFISGVIWLFDVIFLLPRRRSKIDQFVEKKTDSELDSEATKQAVEKLSKESLPVEYAISFFPVLFIVLVLRSFLVEPFQIPSGSMKPTLQIGDFILVNKFTYGIRLPVAETRIIELNDPERGDVMVFRYPRNEKINYIKRVVGLPGDTVRYQNKIIYINNEKMTQDLVAQLPPGSPVVQMLSEQLGDVEHKIYNDINNSSMRAVEWVVPEGHYFMMGDNRDNSNDSRFWGFVPEQNIVGKAFAVWMHWESVFSLPSFSRNGGIQ